WGWHRRGGGWHWRRGGWIGCGRCGGGDRRGRVGCGWRGPERGEHGGPVADARAWAVGRPASACGDAMDLGAHVDLDRAFVDLHGAGAGSAVDGEAVYGALGERDHAAAL